MLAELLLVLAGHPSAFFIPSPPKSPTTYITSPTLAEYLHPGEISSLNTLGQIAFRYAQIRQWALSTQSAARKALLESTTSRKGKAKADVDGGPGVYAATLAGAVLDVLGEYEGLIVDTETKVLSLDPGMVQDEKGFVPLGTLLATFDAWQSPMLALQDLILQVSQPPDGAGRILDLVSAGGETGNPRLADLFNTLSKSLTALFLTHLSTFLLFGQAPTVSTPSEPAMAIDDGPEPNSPQHRQYRLSTDLFPRSIGQGTRDSILYIGRVAATLQREGKSFPTPLVLGLRKEIMDAGLGDGLAEAIKRARGEVGEWLWKHILTGVQVVDALEALYVPLPMSEKREMADRSGDYFLARQGEYALAHIREIHRLRLNKLVTGNPHSSSSIIREQDLNTALLRASVGTAAETDPALEKLGWRMENGPLRPLLPSSTSRPPAKTSPIANTASTRDLFSSSLLGTPLSLTMEIGWPLDLLLTPSTLSAYADIHAYLYAFRDTHLRVLDSWTSLSGAQRQRRKWTLDTEGGDPEEAAARRALARSAWGTVRIMLFWLDQMQSHFMLDIIDVQHRRLLDSLADVDGGAGVGTGRSLAGSTRGSTRAMSKRSVPDLRGPPSPVTESIADTQTVRSRAVPPTPRKAGTTFLDFLTLRHLSFLQEGLLIGDRPTAVLIRDILEVCKRFTALVERWGGDVLPPLLEESKEVGSLVRERSAAIKEINENLHDLLSEFFRILVESQNPPLPSEASVSAAGVSFSRTARTMQISRVMSRQVSFSGAAKKGVPGRSKDQIEKDEKGLEAEALMGRHIEQLLLRLDFNGVLTDWMSREEDGVVGRDILPAR